jgi:putative nucleotidyltransferase with HDIG domain
MSIFSAWPTGVELMKRSSLLNFGKTPERSITNFLNAALLLVYLPVPVFFYYQDMTLGIKLLCYALWTGMLVSFILRMKHRGKKGIADSFESGVYAFILTLLYFLSGNQMYLAIVMAINVDIFAMFTTLPTAVTLSFFQTILYVLGKAFYLSVDTNLYDIRIPIFLVSGIAMGLLGEMNRSSIEKSRLLEESQLDTMQAFAEALEAKDIYTFGHSRRVSKYSRKLAESIGLDDAQVKSIEKAALLHDIGKIGISDNILNKKGTLTNKEFSEIKKHSEIGEKILSGLKVILPPFSSLV